MITREDFLKQQHIVSYVTAISTVCFAAIIPYISVLNTYFAGDDFGDLPWFAGNSFSRYPSFFWSSWIGNIWGFTLPELRPFPALSLKLDSLWGTSDPFVYHLSTLALHMCTALIVFFVAIFVVRISLFAAVFSGVLFAVLPVQVEIVFWILGRSDILVSLFCLLSFLFFSLWKRHQIRWMYILSFISFITALFSKEVAIPFPLLFIMYDIIYIKAPFKLSKSIQYIPFIIVVGCYLYLRTIIFGHTIPQSSLTTESLQWWVKFETLIIIWLTVGSRRDISDIMEKVVITVMCLASIIAFIIFAWRKWTSSGAKRISDWITSVFFFGPIWILLTTSPLLSSYYIAPRHVYLASAGFSIGIGSIIHILFSHPSRIWNYTSIFISFVLISLCILRQLPSIASWNASSQVSLSVVHDIERETSLAPSGSLIVMGVPTLAGDPSEPVMSWAWSIPFVLRPPFLHTDVTQRLFFVASNLGYCCSSWLEDTQNAIHRWRGASISGPIIVLVWNPTSGVLTKYTDAEHPDLRTRILDLQRAKTVEDLTRKLDHIFEQADPLSTASERVFRKWSRFWSYESRIQE